MEDGIIFFDLTLCFVKLKTDQNGYGVENDRELESRSPFWTVPFYLNTKEEFAPKRWVGLLLKQHVVDAI